MGTPKALGIEIDKNFKQKLLHLGSVIKDQSESQPLGIMPETELYREPYDVHAYENHFQIESSIKKMMEDADRITKEGGRYALDQYFIEPEMGILRETAIPIEKMENEINDLMNITPEKLMRFEAEFKGETATKRKADIREPQRKIDEHLEERIERVIEGYEKLGEMKLTIDALLNRIIGESAEKKMPESILEVNPEVKEIMDAIQGVTYDEESYLISST